METYFEDIASRAEQVALSYERCRELIIAKAERIGTEGYSLRVERATLKPGRCEVILNLKFADSDHLEIMVDVDRGVVHYVKFYPAKAVSS